jgi:hypothetical protein
MYFPKPIMCNVMEHETKTRLKWGLNRDTPEKKVKGLMKAAIMVEVWPR